LRHIYSLRHNETLSLNKVQRDLELPNDYSLRTEIEEKLRVFYKKFKIQPISLTYSVLNNEYLLKIDHSYVGNIVFKKFVIQIIPKHINLSSEKILKLSIYTGQENQVLSGGNHYKGLKGQDESIDSLSLFYDLFLDKVSLYIRNGIIHGFVQRQATLGELKGVLDVNKHLRFPVPKNLAHQIVKSKTPNIKFNQLIKALILDIVNKTTKSDLIIKSKSLLSVFHDVSNIDLPNFLNTNDFKLKNLSRSDYEEVLEVAEILINGFDPDSNTALGFLPEYLINLDLMFERICYFFIKDILNKDFFNVYYQKNHPHLFSQLNVSGEIIPDIYVTSDNSDFLNSRIVLDAKNKYSGLDDAYKVSLSDIYQLYYYSNVLNSKYIIILYPGSSRNCSRYPLKGSKGEGEYNKSRMTKISDMWDSNQIVNFKGVYYIFWRVNLEGSLKDTKNSFDELSNLIAEIMSSDDILKNR